MTKSKLGRKEFLSLIFPYSDPSWTAVGAETRRQGLKQMQPVEEAAYCYAPHGFFNPLVIEAKTISPGMAPLITGWALSHQSLRKCTTDLSTV